ETELTQKGFDCGIGLCFMFSGLRSAELFWVSSGVPSRVEEATRLLRRLGRGSVVF
ncbi:1456_t:CDS:2, partial [Dentiscutata heterogama]